MGQRAGVASKRLLLLMAVLACGIALLVANNRDFAREFAKSLRGFRATSLGIALLCVVAQVALQSLRFWAVAPRETRLAVLEAGYIFTLGDWTNIFAPVRGGDVLKVVMLRRAASGQLINLPRGAGIVLADRIVEAVGLLICCATSGALGLVVAAGRTLPISPAVVTAGGGIAAVLLVFVAVARQAWAARLRDGWRHVLQGLSTLAHPVQCLLSVSFALSAWAAELLALGVLCAALGFSPAAPRLLLALVLVNIGNSVPLTFASLGVYETALAYGLLQAGLPLPSAVAVATAHHGVELLGLGLCAGAFAVAIHVLRPGTPDFVPGGQDAR